MPPVFYTQCKGHEGVKYSFEFSKAQVVAIRWVKLKVTIFN